METFVFTSEMCRKCDYWYLSIEHRSLDVKNLQRYLLQFEYFISSLNLLPKCDVCVCVLYS